ncbi:DUF3311 domain-containing protein [Arthrobacter sp. efr-133-TYG-104]|uniref:DUF3311 domain-containing protein n=1 Tax=Arthrobacter sp. efr-133-TYG-104 TaxID=3040324 RepID=UPI00254B6AAF|nr:DUF3311 domain-containing protein [Arthrobacter sp. efr-133-TYG-104]
MSSADMPTSPEGPARPDVPTDRDTPTRGPAKSAPYVIAGILLAIAIVVPLFVPSYSSNSPRLAGIPFFYWYQMLWVPITAGLVGISYQVVVREDRRRRDAIRGGVGQGEVR